MIRKGNVYVSGDHDIIVSGGGGGGGNGKGKKPPSTTIEQRGRLAKYSPSGQLLAEYLTSYDPGLMLIYMGVYNGTEFVYSRQGLLGDPGHVLYKHNLSDLSFNSSGGCHGLVFPFGVVDVMTRSVGSSQYLFAVGHEDNLANSTSGSDMYLKKFVMGSDGSCTEDTVNWNLIINTPGTNTHDAGGYLQFDDIGDLYLAGHQDAQLGMDNDIIVRRFMGPTN